MMQWGLLMMSSIKVTLIDKEERDTLLWQAEGRYLSTWPMPKPTISNQIIPEPTQALTRARPTVDKRSCHSLSLVKRYPF